MLLQAEMMHVHVLPFFQSTFNEKLNFVKAKYRLVIGGLVCHFKEFYHFETG
jgi:hypothetical protein